MATKKQAFDFSPETVKFLDSINMSYEKPSYCGAPDGKEFMIILDHNSNYVVQVHYTTTPHGLRCIFSYGKSQHSLGKKSAQRTIIEALGLDVDDDKQSVQFTID